jgi:hypothetical protein
MIDVDDLDFSGRRTDEPLDPPLEVLHDGTP